MLVTEIRKHARAINRIQNSVARDLEMRTRAAIIAESVSPKYAKRLMHHKDLQELLDCVWLYSTAIQYKRDTARKLTPEQLSEQIKNESLDQTILRFGNINATAIQDKRDAARKLTLEQVSEQIKTMSIDELINKLL